LKPDRPPRRFWNPAAPHVGFGPRCGSDINGPAGSRYKLIFSSARTRCTAGRRSRKLSTALHGDRFGACVDGSGLARRAFTAQHWSEQPFVRPVCAVHMTAGHQCPPRIRSRSRAACRQGVAAPNPQCKVQTAKALGLVVPQALLVSANRTSTVCGSALITRPHSAMRTRCRNSSNSK
jgi:hypothetical protein